MRLILFLLSFVIHADLSNNIDIHKEKYEKLALEIWSLAEMGYLETKSSKLLQDTLNESGFKVKSGIADIPTACLLYTSPSPRD